MMAADTFPIRIKNTSGQFLKLFNHRFLRVGYCDCRFFEGCCVAALLSVLRTSHLYVLVCVCVGQALFDATHHCDPSHVTSLVAAAAARRIMNISFSCYTLAETFRRRLTRCRSCCHDCRPSERESKHPRSQIAFYLSWSQR